VRLTVCRTFSDSCLITEHLVRANHAILRVESLVSRIVHKAKSKTRFDPLQHSMPAYLDRKMMRNGRTQMPGFQVTGSLLRGPKLPSTP